MKLEMDRRYCLRKVFMFMGKLMFMELGDRRSAKAPLHFRTPSIATAEGGELPLDTPRLIAA